MRRSDRFVRLVLVLATTGVALSALLIVALLLLAAVAPEFAQYLLGDEPLLD
jgi:ABC-type lipoprotein release transport system permease subunit